MITEGTGLITEGGRGRVGTERLDPGLFVDRSEILKTSRVVKMQEFHALSTNSVLTIPSWLTFAASKKKMQS